MDSRAIGTGLLDWANARHRWQTLRGTVPQIETLAQDRDDDMTTVKGTAPVTSTQGDAPTNDERGSVRRRMLTGGVAAMAFAAVGTQRVAAAPSALPKADMDLLRYAQRLELAARDLYDEAIAAGAADPLWETMSEQHEAYAHGIAGLTGLSADSRDDDQFGRLRVSFRGADALKAAYDLESALVATHLEVVGTVASSDSAELIASIISAESRHCVVLADLLGLGNQLGATLDNTAEPILP